jgi:cellulose synthase/poly-beta-1,6-N-acetylglucosamine synthase-like glycosyltransferase
MCLTARALEESGGFGTSLVEDQELGVRCFLAGFPVHWLHDLRVADEKPITADVAASQRARWQSGRRQVARRWFLALLKRRTRGSWDLALRLVQPSRAGIALLSALLAVAAALGAPLWPWQVWASIALIQLLGPLAFLVRDGVAPRYLARYPLMILLPLLKVLARFRRNRGWYHTPHGVSSPPP